MAEFEVERLVKSTNSYFYSGIEYEYVIRHVFTGAHVVSYYGTDNIGTLSQGVEKVIIHESEIEIINYNGSIMYANLPSAVEVYYEEQQDFIDKTKITKQKCIKLTYPNGSIKTKKFDY